VDPLTGCGTLVDYERRAGRWSFVAPDGVETVLAEQWPPDDAPLARPAALVGFEPPVPASPVDPVRLERLAAAGAVACGPATAAVVLHAGESTVHPALPAAFASVVDGADLWVCPGVHGVERTLELRDVTNVLLAGRDALVLAAANVLVLSISNATQIWIEGLAFGHDLRWGTFCRSDVVRVAWSTGVTVQGARFDGSGIVGLSLKHVTSAEVSDSLFVNCEIGFEALDSRHVSLRRNRFAYNDVHVERSAREVATIGNELGPEGRERPEPPAAMPAPGVAEWPDWEAMLSASEAYAVREWNGAHYLVVDYEMSNEGLAGAPMPPCFEDAGCSEPVPYPGDDSAALPPEVLASVQVITPAGPCTPALGPAVMLDTSGCNRSVTLARQIDGCGESLAPIALPGRLLWPLTWHPRTEERFEADARGPTDAELQSWLAEVLRDSVVGSWSIPASTEQRTLARWRVELPQETLTTLLAGFQVKYQHCEIYAQSWSRTVLATGSAEHELGLPSPSDEVPWTGVLALHDRVAAIAGQGSWVVALTVRGADGLLEPALFVPYWTDHEECSTPQLPHRFPYPCGP
jgi:hypothetical protein